MPLGEDVCCHYRSSEKSVRVHPLNSRYRLLGNRYYLQISFIPSQILSTITSLSRFSFYFILFYFYYFSVCECNGHANSCDSVTGHCNCLARYVTGKNCERYILFYCDYINLRTLVCLILVEFDCARSDVVKSLIRIDIDWRGSHLQGQIKSRQIIFKVTWLSDDLINTKHFNQMI